MQAIKIRVLAPTRHRPTRLKAEAGAGSMIESRQYELDIDVQAYNLAQYYCKHHHWDCEIEGFGQLSSGEWVATLEGSTRKYDLKSCDHTMRPCVLCDKEDAA